MFTTATALAAMRWAQDWYLFALGAVAFTGATAGYLHRRRHRPGDTGHVAGMGIGYTAMLTAFYVDNGPHLPLWDRLPTLAFWILPVAIATPSSPARSTARGRSYRQQRATQGQAQHETTDAEAERSTGYAFTCSPGPAAESQAAPGREPGRAESPRRRRRIPR